MMTFPHARTGHPSAGGALLDSLDRTDLLWFARHPGEPERQRQVMPAEAVHLREKTGVRPKRVVITLTPVRGVLIRDYGGGVKSVAVVAPSIVDEVCR